MKSKFTAIAFAAAVIGMFASSSVQARPTWIPRFPIPPIQIPDPLPQIPEPILMPQLPEPIIVPTPLPPIQLPDLVPSLPSH